jgi:hypothetical protein
VEEPRSPGGKEQKSQGVEEGRSGGEKERRSGGAKEWRSRSRNGGAKERAYKASSLLALLGIECSSASRELVLALPLRLLGSSAPLLLHFLAPQLLHFLAPPLLLDSSTPWILRWRSWPPPPLPCESLDPVPSHLNF